MFTPAPLKDFSEDKLNFKSFANDLTNTIMSSLPHPVNEYSKVIALDSGWGTGKTSFINMWTKELETGSKFICRKYNAWENDDSPDALIPILCRILYNEDTPKTQEMKESFANFADIISIFGPRLFGLATQAICGVNLEGLAEAAKEYREKKLPDMIFKEFTARQKHKELFRELTENIRGEHAYLLICIDELDRCRPTFAIETLEVVKHFFDLENVIFVFSLDLEQLQKSIKILYGDIDSMGYLRRFFDHTIHLPPLSELKLDNFLKDRFTFVQSSAEINILSSLAKRFSISLRVLNGICVAYCQLREYMLTKYAQENDFKRGIRLRIYLPFIAMKYSDPEKYQSLLQKGSSDGLGKEILGFTNISSWVDRYTEKSAHLTRAEDYSEWDDMIDLFSLRAVANSDEPIYKLIDKNIENSLLKAKGMQLAAQD